ncbi:protein MALE DISCOVERER 2 [Dendrobium catenatum]|uniref:Putative LRR receptor-like serine/threonine-protein kinase MRH1 n=1 Tax=Dendrobium catenatum TaxID=906689 RepID=A0A2I0VP86_9ASPA|nr:protein MALE DISCOVERER 2 [Dendrobium catenatum]PKU65227.1 putative LRR receptor-like serine/threonine-protein kinase MRH1 [Dendrobium catenatum]
MERMEKWRLRLDSFLLLLIPFSCWRLCVCDSIEAEGRALLSFREGVEVDPYGALSNWGKSGVDHCFWFGVECSDDGRAVSLDLRDLFLQGKLTSELARLIHLKSLILHNNSFSGSMPREISKLLKLEVLDLGHNNLSGPFPHFLLGIVSLKLVVLTNNRFVKDISPKLLEFNLLSELHGDEEMSSSNKGSVIRNIENPSTRRLLQQISKNKVKPQKHGGRRNSSITSAPSTSPMTSPSPSPKPSESKYQSSLVSPSSHSHLAAAPSPGIGESRRPVYITVGAGAFALFSLSSMYFICCRTIKVDNASPWKIGLSGKLQKALVTGVPSLERSELQTACEEFSNVIDTLSDCTIYKGTLSSGVEIAVSSTMIKMAKDWSDQSEALFRNKISVLSTVNHKNFLNLIGFCVEQEPFTRMMVYEYAPNGTLFEHLHIKEAEPLDWTTRLRIAMGISYCLEHFLRLDPPVSFRALNSSTIYLTEDYAAKVSDLSFWNEENEATSSDQSSDDLQSPLSNQDIVYKFGIILLELISGRLPFSKDDGLLVLWASSHLTGKRPLHGILDQTIESLSEEDISPLCQVIQSCVTPQPSGRPKMGDVVAQLREITGISPDAASPKLSPLWWAELEIIS